MIGDAKEHICNGCHQLIASHDPEAYQKGPFYYHSKLHEERHAALSWNNFLKAEGKRSRAAVHASMTSQGAR